MRSVVQQAAFRLPLFKFFFFFNPLKRFVDTHPFLYTSLASASHSDGVLLQRPFSDIHTFPFRNPPPSHQNLTHTPFLPKTPHQLPSQPPFSPFALFPFPLSPKNPRSNYPAPAKPPQTNLHETKSNSVSSPLPPPFSLLIYLPPCRWNSSYETKKKCQRGCSLVTNGKKAGETKWRKR